MPARRALPEVVRTPLGDRWAEAVAGMQATGSLVALVRELALQSELVAIAPGADGQGEQWQLRVEREPLRAPPLVDKLQKALQAWAGQPSACRRSPAWPRIHPRCARPSAWPAASARPKK
jgi:DNA polymerase-3 subunit gamma/tau